MMTGEAPWWHKDQKELQRKIAHTKLRLPTWLTNEAKSIIRGLLTKDPATYAPSVAAEARLRTSLPRAACSRARRLLFACVME